MILPSGTATCDDGRSVAMARAAAGEFHFAAIRATFDQLGAGDDGWLPSGCAVGVSYYGWRRRLRVRVSSTASGDTDHLYAPSGPFVTDCLAEASAPSVPSPVRVAVTRPEGRGG